MLKLHSDIIWIVDFSLVVCKLLSSYITSHFTDLFSIETISDDQNWHKHKYNNRKFIVIVYIYNTYLMVLLMVLLSFLFNRYVLNLKKFYHFTPRPFNRVQLKKNKFIILLLKVKSINECLPRIIHFYLTLGCYICIALMQKK